jgi:hypothetical protein
MKCWVCQQFTLHSLVRINGRPTRRKAPALQGTRKTTKKRSTNRNIRGETYFYEVLGMPARRHTLPGSYKWPSTCRKAPALQGARKTTKKGSKNRNIMGETDFYGVLGMPARRPTLPGSNKWAQRAEKLPHCRELEKLRKKVKKSKYNGRNLPFEGAVHASTPPCTPWSLFSSK